MAGLLTPRYRRRGPRHRPLPLVDKQDPGAPQEDFGERAAQEIGEAEKEMNELAAEIAADPSLLRRPTLRRLREYVASEVMKNIDGSPVRDRQGNEIKMGMTLEQVLVQAATAAAANQNHPKQYEFLQLLWKYQYGAPPSGEAPAVDHPPPPPAQIPDGERGDGAPVEPPPASLGPNDLTLDQVQAGLTRIGETVRQLEEVKRAADRDATAIDVKAELLSGDGGKP